MQVLGVDIGGSGIKGALVDLNSGKFVGERVRIETPQPATPAAMTSTFVQLIKELDYKGQIVGVGFPAIVQNGVTLSASNIDNSWIGVNIEEMLSTASGLTVKAVNDADAAGVAEMSFGVGKEQQESVDMLITIGTGLGSAVFVNGLLVPNTELGHLQMKGMIAERYAANSIRKKEDLSWSEWGNRFNEYLLILNRLFSPNRVILGGGVSKKFHKFEQYLTAPMNVVPADLLNSAGIVGAASYAYQKTK